MHKEFKKHQTTQKKRDFSMFIEKSLFFGWVVY